MLWVGVSHINPFVFSCAMVAILLTPNYVLWLFHRMCFASITPLISWFYNDLSILNQMVLSIVLLLCLLLGLAPINANVVVRMTRLECS